ncbi:MAG TPA: kinase/pyrophosphorylase, partial [Candidatus Methylomirabilis sp.]|nr:kinase/pyrophosphorylase [Candidatus Methylomirabilis sp.]
QIWAELEYAHSQFGRAGWPVVDVTDKSIEEVAAEVLLFTGIERPSAPRSAARSDRPSTWRRTSE